MIFPGRSWGKFGKHRFSFFPVGNSSSLHVEEVLARIRARHAIDDSSAQDLIAALDPESTEPDRFPPEMLGYMLRCFFDGCRRAMDFTELAILALGERRLTRDARALLIGSLARS